MSVLFLLVGALYAQGTSGGGMKPPEGGEAAGAGAAAGRPGDARRAIVKVRPGDGTTEMKLTVTAKGAAPVDVTLNDSGTAPDFRAGDGELMGEVRLPGDTVSLSITVGGKTVDAGTVSWEAEAVRRLLEITFEGGKPSAKASVGEKRAEVQGGGMQAGGMQAGGMQAGGMQGGAAMAAGGQSAGGLKPPIAGQGGTGMQAGGAAAMQGGAAMARGAGMQPTAGMTAGGAGMKPPMDGAAAAGGGGSSWVFPVAVLVGLVAVGAIVSLLPKRRGGADADPPGLTRVPPEGLFGPGTPSLESGLRLWGVSADDRPAFLAQLLGALAPHPVVVVVDEATALPPASGGPVFRTRSDPAAVVRSARTLSAPGRPTVIVVVPPLGELPAGAWPSEVPDCRLIHLVAPHPEGVEVSVGREPGGWRIRTATTDARVRDRG